ncbi:MAG: DUF3102 domain-containing protein [Leptolyngbyaceae cyanobacterium SM1_3_5]|nr:DUF3102 domain-containing protein [Leptolyngbyaceae cyanobacterium SM1_3_5]
MIKKKNAELVVNHFDYQVLPPEQRSIVQQRTGEIHERLQRSAQDIWEIGQRLADVRSQLKHGQFDAWIKAEFGWSRRTAYNFINVYETFQERANLAQIDIATSALYLLAAPSTPPQVREQYIEQAKTGKKVTHKDLRETIDQAKIKPVATQPEIITVIPRSAPVEAPVIIEPTIEIHAALKPGWYLVGDRHLVLCGDTAASTFFDRIPGAALVVAATANDWDHDWIIEAARTVVILQEAELNSQTVEQLITMFTQPEETIVFPWLPQADLIAIADRQNRKVIAGDPSPNRCQQRSQRRDFPLFHSSFRLFHSSRKSRT